MSLSVPANLTIYGAGDLETRGGGNATIITDNIASTSQGIFEFIYNRDDGYFRISGITVSGGSGLQKESGGMFEIGGTGQNLIFDHNSVDAGPTAGSQKMLYLTGYVEGVIYENVFDAGDDLNWVHVANGGTATRGDNGDTRWDDDTGFGTADFLFIEDNDFTGELSADPEQNRPNHSATDCHTGGKYVARYNRLVNTALGQTHPTVHAGDDRGCRAHELYGNTGTGTFDPAKQAPVFVFEYNNSGPAIVWGNSLGSGIYSSFWYFNNCRSETGGDCGYGNGGGWSRCGLRSVWDGNTGAGGYPCIDQPGRGKGDPLNGDFPRKINMALGVAGYPRQLSEPVYIWLNSGTRNTGWGGATINNNDTTTIVENRDFYIETRRFTGATGVGSGTRASRPATCTTGVAYWSTDQGGDWNTVSGGANDGTLDLCTAANTWTNGWYTPYTYPHPLRR